MRVYWNLQLILSDNNYKVFIYREQTYCKRNQRIVSRSLDGTEMKPV